MQKCTKWDVYGNLVLILPTIYVYNFPDTGVVLWWKNCFCLPSKTTMNGWTVSSAILRGGVGVCCANEHDKRPTMTRQYSWVREMRGKEAEWGVESRGKEETEKWEKTKWLMLYVGSGENPNNNCTKQIENWIREIISPCLNQRSLINKNNKAPKNGVVKTER